MLFILTGDVQTGKTRWLESLIDSLNENGISAQGVLAPGVWRSGNGPDAVEEYVDENGFEKGRSIQMPKAKKQTCSGISTRMQSSR